MIWLPMLPVWFIFNLSAYLFAPILPLFSTLREGPCDNANRVAVEPRLPTWLAWYDTPDNSLYGDYAWRNEHCQDGWETYWGAVKWLWRNPACGFEQHGPLAASIAPTDVPKAYGNINVQDKPVGCAGVCFTRVGIYWHLCTVIKTLPGYCLYWNFGWRLKTYAENPERVKTEPTARYIFSPRFNKFNS